MVATSPSTLPELDRAPSTDSCPEEANDGLRMVPQVCCLCGISDVAPVAVGEDFEYRTSPDTFVAVRCRRCRLVYLDPRPVDEEFSRIYPETYHSLAFEPESYGLVGRVRQRLEAGRLKRSMKGLPNDARILDVGCGDGFHLRLLRDHGQPGWQLEGLDLDPRAVVAAARNGLEVRRGRVEDDSLPAESYDVVLLVMTIEHVANPVRTLASIRRVLKPNGRVVVVTDNTRTLHAWWFRERCWGGYHFPRHWNLFNRDNLARAAELAGLETDRVSTETNPVNWVYSIHNLLADLNAPGWLRRRFTLKSVVSLSFFTLVDGFLNLFGRGSNLRGVFRRPSVDSPDSRSERGT